MGTFENDRAFESVLQNTGKIDRFLDEFFSFLARRTDFFVVSPPEGGNVGFPPGVAAKLIISNFKKWERLKGGTPSSSSEAAEDVPPAATEVVLADSPIPPPDGKQTTPHTHQLLIRTGSTRNDGDTTIKKTDLKTEEQKSGLSDSYNGRKTDKYSWSQTFNELDVQIAVSGNVKTKHDIQVEIQTSRIRVCIPKSSEPVLVDWTLSNPIVKDESYWSLHPGEAVLLCLQKTRDRWWDHLFDGEELLDRSKIEAVRPMEDLDEEENAKIQELVWNQEQKMKGLPTSDQLKLEDVMRKAWDAEGSPFKGQPFDPSRVQLADNSINFPTPNPNK